MPRGTHLSRRVAVLNSGPFANESPGHAGQIPDINDVKQLDPSGSHLFPAFGREVSLVPPAKAVFMRRPSTAQMRGDRRASSATARTHRRTRSARAFYVWSSSVCRPSGPPAFSAEGVALRRCYSGLPADPRSPRFSAKVTGLMTSVHDWATGICCRSDQFAAAWAVYVHNCFIVLAQVCAEASAPANASSTTPLLTESKRLGSNP